MNKIPENVKKQIALDVNHIFESGVNEIRVIELIERLLSKPYNMLNEIEAWLSFNQSPDKENITALKNDIKKLIQ